MKLSQKCNYALQALIELAKRAEQGPVSISAISEARAVPMQFLQSILREMKGGGFVDSSRGKHGGYFLTRDPRTITLGDVIRFIEGDVFSANPSEGGSRNAKWGKGLSGVFQEIGESIRRVYDGFTIADLLARESDSRAAESYVI